MDWRTTNFRLWCFGVRTGRKLIWFRFEWMQPGKPRDGKTPLWRYTLSTLFEPRDMWVGWYWDIPENEYGHVHVYFCLIPCLPLKLHVRRIYGTGGPG